MCGVSRIICNYTIYVGGETFEYLVFTKAENCFALCTFQLYTFIISMFNLIGTIFERRAWHTISEHTQILRGWGAYQQSVDNNNRIAIVKWMDNKGCAIYM